MSFDVELDDGPLEDESLEDESDFVGAAALSDPELDPDSDFFSLLLEPDLPEFVDFARESVL